MIAPDPDSVVESREAESDADGPTSAADWGLPAGKRRVESNTRFGIALIVVLLATLGIVVYKKIEKHRSASARAGETALATAGKGDPPQSAGKSARSSSSQHSRGEYDGEPATPAMAHGARSTSSARHVHAPARLERSAAEIEIAVRQSEPQVTTQGRDDQPPWEQSPRRSVDWPGAAGETHEQHAAASPKSAQQRGYSSNPFADADRASDFAAQQAPSATAPIAQNPFATGATQETSPAATTVEQQQVATTQPSGTATSPADEESPFGAETSSVADLEPPPIDPPATTKVGPAEDGHYLPHELAPADPTGRTAVSEHSGFGAARQQWEPPRTAQSDHPLAARNHPLGTRHPLDPSPSSSTAATAESSIVVRREPAGAATENPFAPSGRDYSAVLTHGSPETSLPLPEDQPAVHLVQPGDHYWRISRKAYGTARYFEALALYNQHRIPDPRKMQPGMKVLVPDRRILDERFARLLGRGRSAAGPAGAGPHDKPAGFFVDASGAAMYRVGPKDTLGAIALRHLGRSARWAQIYQMNRDRLTSPAELKIGTELRLPADASRIRVVSSEPADR